MIFFDENNTCSRGIFFNQNDTYTRNENAMREELYRQYSYGIIEDWSELVEKLKQLNKEGK